MDERNGCVAQTILTESEKIIKIENDFISLGLSRQSEKGIVSFVEKAMEYDFVDSSIGSAAYEILIRNYRGDLLFFTSRDAEEVTYSMEKGENSTYFLAEFSNLGQNNIDVSLRIDMKETSSIFTFNLHISNQSDKIISYGKKPSEKC